MNKIKFKQCAIYTRVSTDMQAEKEFSSCEAQEQKIRSFIASQNNWQVFKIYSDAGYSGATLNRPAIQQLLSDVKKGEIDIILVYKIDRLTRSPKDFYQLIEIFEQNNVSFISITERFDTSTPAGRLLRNIMLTFAQFERELTSERTKDKLLERVKKGMWNGGHLPFGYERKDKKLIINKKESEIVRLIFETYLETSSINSTYDLLKEKKIKNRQGKIFSKAHLALILRNIAYAGKIKYAGQIYQGIHQPIISQELFELTQKTHKRRIKKFRIYKYFLLGGLIRCKECGYKMSACFTNKHRNGKLKRYYYYRCTSVNKKGWQACSLKEVSAERIENYILENLEQISLDKNYIENLVFKLNHSLNTPCEDGIEPSNVCSKFSAETIISILQSFLFGLATQKGTERNLFVKRFIKEIIYSEENIKINLFYSENLGNFKNFSAGKSPARLQAGGAEIPSQNKENSIFSKKSEFVSDTTSAQIKPFQTFSIILPNLIHKSRKRNLKRYLSGGFAPA